MMWLQRGLELIGREGAIAFIGPPGVGVGSLMAALEQSDLPLVWMGFTPEDTFNPQSQGRKLAHAVNRKLGRGLLPDTLTVEEALETLDASLHYLTPLLLACSGAEHIPELIPELLELHRSGCRVLLHFGTLPPTVTLPENVQRVTAEMLRLTYAEALELTEGRLPETEVRQFCDASEGYVECFMTLLHQRLELPPYLTPSPSGPRPLSGKAATLDPAALLALLIKKARWVEALEVAASNLPERVPEVLEVAGHHYHAGGLHKQLHILLESLPEAVQAHEVVRLWRLQAAFRLGRAETLLKEVEAYLAAHEAPELRAVYAGVFPHAHEVALAQAEQAYRAKRTPLTAFQVGRLTYGPEALDILKESVRLAESEGYPYEAARNAGALAAKLIWHGKYQEAAGWGQWALREFHNCIIEDSQRQLRTANIWVFARLMTGETAGLEQLIREHELSLTVAYPALAQLFRDTLGDYLIANARPAEALHYFRVNFELSARERVAEVVLKIVRALLELNQHDEAFATARQALEVTKDVTIEMQAPAQLAFGMVLAMTDPVAAREFLQRARKVFAEFHNAYRLAQTELYLAYTYVATGEGDRVRDALAGSYDVLSSLSPSALRLLSGPEEAFRPVWALWLGERGPLELRLLGRKEVWWQGKKLELYPQWLEILTVLAIRARSLTLEALLAELYGDGGSKSTLKSAVSRLRDLLPVSSHPYVLTSPVQADFLDVSACLARGDLAGAIRRYRGSLLSGSEVACIREYDEVLVESLRKASLEKQDLESLLRLGELFPDDLELLESASGLLEESDPRAPLVLARREKLERNW